MRVLFVTESGIAGHAVRSARLIAALDEINRISVTVLCDNSFASYVRSRFSIESTIVTEDILEPHEVLQVQRNPSVQGLSYLEAYFGAAFQHDISVLRETWFEVCIVDGRVPTRAAAELLRIPCIAVMSCPWVAGLEEFSGDVRRALRLADGAMRMVSRSVSTRSVGLRPVGGEVVAVHGMALLELAGITDVRWKNLVDIGPLPPLSRVRHETDAPDAHTRGSGERVLVTSGSTGGRLPVSVPSDTSCELLTPTPRPFDAWVEFGLSLDLYQADAVYCHGGLGTVLEALDYGLPLTMRPQNAEQAAVAALVEDAGLGRVLDGSTLRSTSAGVLMGPSASDSYRGPSDVTDRGRRTRRVRYDPAFDLRTLSAAIESALALRPARRHLKSDRTRSGDAADAHPAKWPLVKAVEDLP